MTPTPPAEGATGELTEAAVALLLEHSRYPGCTMASLTIREHLEVVEREAAARAVRAEGHRPTSRFEDGTPVGLRDRRRNVALPRRPIRRSRVR